MRRKSKAVVLLIAGIVGFVGLLAALVSNSTPGDPVKVTLKTYTNACAVITLENQTSASFNYVAAVERKIGGKWPAGLELGRGISDNQYGSLGPRQQTALTIPVMVYVPSYAWRITVFYNRPPVKVNSVRFRVGVWCMGHGLSYVSHKLLEVSESNQISTPEMAQIDSVNKN
jgi:hypothetical protein